MEVKEKMFDDISEEIKRLQREINRSFGDFWESKSFRALPNYTGIKEFLT